MKSGMKLMLACAMLMIGGASVASEGQQQSGKCASVKACCTSCCTSIDACCTSLWNWLCGANVQAPRENWQRAEMSQRAHAAAETKLVHVQAKAVAPDTQFMQ